MNFKLLSRRIFSLISKLNNKFLSTTSFISTVNNTHREVTAGVIIIGDEILNGQTDDINTPFLIKNLNLSNISVSKVTIVPDDIDAIVSEISLQSAQCTVVLTSGGIGPTHDDVTYEAVAKAFSEKLNLNSELCNIYAKYFMSRSHSKSAVLKFATIPESAILNFGTSTINGKINKFPVVSMRNIYMLPGVPALLQLGFNVFRSNFKSYNASKFTEEIFLAHDEFTITSILNDAVRVFKEKVRFGSYPSFQHNYYKVKLVLNSPEINVLKEAVDFLRQGLPKGSFVALNLNLLTMAGENVYSFTKNNQAFSSALLATEKALSTYKLSELCLCFNGGKDCTALLHLLYACAQKHQSYDWKQLKTLWIQNGDSFREVDHFIQETVKKYNLNLITVNGSLKEATSQVLSMHPDIKAVVLGVRRGDPGAENLSYFSPTDADWPSVIRILPLLDCSYADVWTFVRTLQVPYCVLYDRGYTSLGTRSSTKQNPCLRIGDDDHSQFKPAYMLENEQDERGSRE